MADSPKCRECRDKGVEAQTYKVAGKGAFKCHECGGIFSRDYFNEQEFLWKEKQVWGVSK